LLILRVLEKRVLLRIYRYKRQETIGIWKKFCNEECNTLHSPPNSTGVIKQKVAEMGEACNTYDRQNNKTYRDATTWKS
jgi:hypothetical protein